MRWAGSLAVASTILGSIALAGCLAPLTCADTSGLFHIDVAYLQQPGDNASLTLLAADLERAGFDNVVLDSSVGGAAAPPDHVWIAEHVPPAIMGSSAAERIAGGSLWLNWVQGANASRAELNFSSMRLQWASADEANERSPAAEGWLQQQGDLVVTVLGARYGGAALVDQRVSTTVWRCPANMNP